MAWQGQYFSFMLWYVGSRQRECTTWPCTSSRVERSPPFFFSFFFFCALFSVSARWTKCLGYNMDGLRLVAIRAKPGQTALTKNATAEVRLLKMGLPESLRGTIHNDPGLPMDLKFDCH
jgi:hypothetical protein